MPQLDALRTVAVLLVIVFHWFPTGEGINRLPNGTIGVLIFFVLSGFLITQILLKNRNAIHAGQTTPGHVYRNFLIRRALRIYPLYYLTITFVFILLPKFSDIDEHPLYYYFYGSNILLQRTGNWADILSPFWTLAVEEQLYLIWPWVVLVTPKNAFHWILGLMIGSGVAFRAFAYVQGNLDGVLTPACLDSFGMGALWAYVTIDQSTLIPSFLKKMSIASLLALGTFFALLFLPTTHFVVVLLQRFTISILALFAISRASIGVGGWIGQVLNNKALQYFGRISYGIYVFHMLVPSFGVELVVTAFHRFGVSLTLGYWTHRLLSLVILLTSASLSWYIFEKPLNNLKRYVPYKLVSQPISR
ncbi:acyltransferase [Spirosoma sp. KCTC 42546]|nr:acyltransferase [Spirosoma sp. KCTC 42546]